MSVHGPDNGPDNLPEPGNPEESLEELARRFELSVTAIPQLKETITQKVMGADRYQAAQEKEQLRIETLAGMSDEEWDRFGDNIESDNHERYGEIVSTDPDLGLLEAIQIKLARLEANFLAEGMIVAEENGLKTVSEPYVTEDGRRFTRFAIIKAHDGKLIADRYDFEITDARAAVDQIEQERELGINGLPLDQEAAAHYTKQMETYYAGLVVLANHEQPALIRRFRLDEGEAE